MSPSVCNGEDPEPVSLCSHLTSQKNPSSSCAVCYLMNSCGLTEKQAQSASKKLNFKTTLNPDTVLTLFQNYGFTKSDIAKLITRDPCILSSDIDKTLKPKLEYFISKEVSRLEVTKVLSANPDILCRNLENHIIPFFDCIKKIVGTDRYVFTVFRRTRYHPGEQIEKLMGNIQVLRDEGVPQSNIVKFLINLPMTLTINTVKFKDIVQGVKAMGFDPYKTAFLTAIGLFKAMAKSTWEAKLNAYRKWGWSEEEILFAFKTYPHCMGCSTKKIRLTMDYLINQMGYNASFMARYPVLLGFSLEKRIIPRCSVYQILVSKGLIKDQIPVCSLFNMNEDAFLEKFVIKYEKEAHELLKGFINEGQVPLRLVLSMIEESFLDKIVIKYQEKAPELMKIYNQALNSRVMDEGVQGSALKNEEEDKSEEDEEIAAVPLDEKVLDDSQVSVLQKKVGVDAVEESMKDIWPKKVMKEPKKKKVMKKVKKKVEELEEVQVSAKKKEKDKAKKEEEMAVVCMAGKELEDSELSVLKREVGKDKVEVSKKAKGPKEAFIKKLKKKVAEVQDSGAIKYVVEAPGLLQAFNRRVIDEGVEGSAMKEEEEDYFKEEQEIVALPMDVKVLEDSQRQKKVGLDKVVLKKDKRPKKVLKKSKTKVEEVQNSAVKKGEEDKSSEDIDDAHVVEKVVEDSQASVVERKVASNKVGESKKAEGPKKVLKKLKIKIKNVQVSAKVEVADKAKKEEAMDVLPLSGEVLEDGEASGIKRMVVFNKVEESKKGKGPMKVLRKRIKKKVEEVQGSAKKEEENKDKEEELKKFERPKKVLKKSSKKLEEVQSSAAIKYDVDAPELLQVSNSHVMECSKSEIVVVCPERDAESVASLPRVAKVSDESQAGKPKKKASSSNLVEQEEELEKVEETKKAKKPKKVLKKSNKKVEDMQVSAAKKEEEDQSKEEEDIVAVPIVEKILEDSHATVLKRKLVLDTGDESKKVDRPTRLLKKSKKKVKEEHCSDAKKEEHDKSKEEDEVAAVSMVEKVLEDSQASMLKSKVSVNKVEESKKAKKIKKVLKKPEKKINELQGNAAIKYEVEVPELLQASNRPVTEDSQNEEVTFCLEKAIQTVAALPKVARVVDKTGKPKKKASSNDLVEQEEELKKKEESKKANKSKKVMKKFKRKVEEVQGSAVKKEEGDKPKEEEDIVAAPIIEKISEDSHATVLKRKLVLDTVEKSKKVKRPKKLLKKSKKKVEEEQCSGATNEERDRSKQEDDVAAVSIIEKVLQDSQASVLKSKFSVDEVEDSKKAKKINKVLKKPEKKAIEVQGGAATKYDAEVPKLLQALNRRVMEKGVQGSAVKKEQEDKSKEEEEIVTVPKEESVVEDSHASVLKKKVVLDEVEESKKAKRPTEIPKKSKKKLKQVPDTAAIKYDVEAPELLQESDSRVIKDSQSEEVAFCPERDAESVAALPKVEKVVANSHGGKPKKKASSINLVEQEEELKRIEETKKAKKLKKVLKKAEKKVEDVRASVAKKGEEDKSEEVVVAVPIIDKILEDSHSSVLKRKLVLDTLEETMTVKRAKKLLKKSKKKVVEEQCSAAKKEEHDKSKEEDKVAAVSMVEKVLEDCQASALKSKVSLDEVEELKKAKKVKKLLKKREKKAHEVQVGAAIKYDVEVPELLQESDSGVMKDSQSEEVSFSPVKDAESVAALLKVAKVVDKSQGGKPKKKASLSDLVEQEEELKKIEETKKAKKLTKVLREAEKKVEAVQGSVAKKEEEDKSEEVVVAVPIVNKILKDSHSSVLKRKLVLDTIEETNKVKRAKKLLKKSKEKVKEEQCSGAKKEEHDKSKEEDEVAAVSMVEKVLEDSHGSVLRSKDSLDEVEESKKAKKIRKALRK